MGILVPSKALSGGNAGVGALTGLLQGLGEGIPIGQQIRNRNRLTEIEQQKQNLEAAQFGAKQSADASSRKAAALLVQFGLQPRTAPGAPSAPSGGPEGSPVQGPMAPGPDEEQGPQLPGDQSAAGRDQRFWASVPDEQGPRPMGEQGPPAPQGQSAGPGPQPSQGMSAQAQPSTSHSRLDWLRRQDFSGISMEDAHRIFEAAGRDEAIQTTQEHANQLGGDLQSKLDKGVYDAVDEDGHPDQTGRVAVQTALDHLKSVDYSNPAEAAKVVDAARAADEHMRVLGAMKHAQFQTRQMRDLGFTQQITDKTQQAVQAHKVDPNITDMNLYYGLWKNHSITDEQMDKMWPDVVNGTLHIKQENERLKTENDRLKNAHLAQQTQNISPEGLDAASARKKDENSALMAQRFAQVDYLRKFQQKNGTPESQTLALQRIRMMAAQDTGYQPDDPSPDKKAAWDQEVEALSKRFSLPGSGGNGAAQSPDTGTSQPAQAPARLPALSRKAALDKQDSAKALLDGMKRLDMTKAEFAAAAKKKGFNTLAEVQEAAAAGAQ